MKIHILFRFCLFIVFIIISIFAFCTFDSEKSLLQSLRKNNLEIIFDPTGGNPVRTDNLVRNHIPVVYKSDRGV